MNSPGMDIISASPRRVRPAAAAVLALALVGVGLAGCKTSDDVITAGLPTDGYRTAYPIVVAEGAETMDIPVGFGSPGLSPSTRSSVRSFAADAARRGTSTLVIMGPRGSGNEAAAAAVVRQARQEALTGGLSPNLVEVRSYPVANRSAAAPVRLSYNRVKAMSPPCGRWTEQMLPGHENGDATEFGCATQANFAAMVSDPQDLITPRAETPPPAARRFLLWGKWTAGDRTSTNQTLHGNETTGGN
jgi:pilus assembly protein CpaD